MARHDRDREGEGRTDAKEAREERRREGFPEGPGTAAKRGDPPIELPPSEPRSRNGEDGG